MSCRFCGSDEVDCYSECECSKCVDPEGYEDWKQTDSYTNWLETKEEDEQINPS